MSNFTEMLKDIPLPGAFEVFAEDEPHGIITGYTLKDLKAYGEACALQALNYRQVEPVGYSVSYNGEHCGNLRSTLLAANQEKDRLNAAFPTDVRDVVPVFAGPSTHRLNRAYEQGWIRSAQWAKREDLICDTGSLAYRVDRDDALKGV